MSTASIMEPTAKAERRPPQAPTIIFTVANQAASVKVIAELRAHFENEENAPRLEVFDSSETVIQFLAEHSSGRFCASRAVVVFDCGLVGVMKHSSRGEGGTGPAIPAWAGDAKWGVAVRATISSERVRTVAHQVRADYIRKYEERVSAGSFPWGQPKRNQSGPAVLTLPGDVSAILGALNSGPDFLGDVDPRHAESLPSGSRISHNRVAACSFRVDPVYLAGVMNAFQELEVASGRLVYRDPSVQRKLLEGVRIHPGVIEAYLFPRNASFSVRRLDVHLKTPTSVFASENDEMPGGLVQAWWYDRAYGVNQEHWQYAMKWLTSHGILLFVVSHDWSKPYISEMTQMAHILAEEGWSIEIITTDKLDALTITDGGVLYAGRRIGTIWRQFPIFEVKGKLAELVRAAQCGVVEMVPEFAHFGNKSWFSLFRESQSFFEGELSCSAFEVLDSILPDTLLVASDGSFPASKTNVGNIDIGDLHGLKDLNQQQRNQLVLKVAGANTLSARSHGVLMGHNLPEDTWNNWITERLRNNEPFIVQSAEPTEVRQEAVYNTTTNGIEMFSCRLLLRPWAIGGRIVSAGIVGATASSRKVHGMTDMFIVPAGVE